MSGVGRYGRWNETIDDEERHERREPHLESPLKMRCPDVKIGVHVRGRDLLHLLVQPKGVLLTVWAERAVFADAQCQIRH
jgi:hypothetical protein